MKWHNIGSGRVQLRLLVAIAHNMAHLCNAYVKDNDRTDKQEMAKLKIKICLINKGTFAYRGMLL